MMIARSNLIQPVTLLERTPGQGLKYTMNVLSIVLECVSIFIYQLSEDNADDILVNKKLSMNKVIAASDYTVE